MRKVGEADDFHKEMGVNLCLEDCIEKLKNEFKLSKTQIAKELREKASEVNPRKRVAYCLPDGTEISKKEYLALKKIFPGKMKAVSQGSKEVKNP